ncbi:MULTISPECIES: hypothetical protein [unclassified Microcoleus]|uniref:hypothetical protein n=1 Tax=unclassified Microcoleus TaxID=2642155 RepID=UPI002FD23730
MPVPQRVSFIVGQARSPKKNIENGTTSLTDGDDISDRLYPSICRETAMSFPARELPFSYENYGSGNAVSLWFSVRTLNPAIR